MVIFPTHVYDSISPEKSTPLTYHKASGNGLAWRSFFRF